MRPPSGTEPRTLVMVKPDGMERPEVLAALEGEIGAAGLTVPVLVDTTLSESEVSALFPSFHESAYPLTRVLVTCYLTSGPVRFLVLEGADALAAGRTIRKTIRSRYALASLANCLHAAADRGEAAHQLDWLARVRGARRDHHSATTARLTPPEPIVPGMVPGRLSALDLRLLGTSVWADLRRSGWAGLWQWPAERGERATFLLTDDVHSLDYVTSVLFEAHPDISAQNALRAVLRVDRTGSAVVFSGRDGPVEELANNLRGHGLTVRSVGI